MLWIPIRVIDDTRVSGSQVDPQPTGPGGQKEQSDVLIVVEAVNVLLSVDEIHGAIQSGELELLVGEVIADNVKHSGHLGEDQDFVLPGQQLHQHLIEDFHLAANVNHVFVGPRMRLNKKRHY